MRIGDWLGSSVIGSIDKNVWASGSSEDREDQLVVELNFAQMRAKEPEFMKEYVRFMKSDAEVVDKMQMHERYSRILRGYQKAKTVVSPDELRDWAIKNADIGLDEARRYITQLEREVARGGVLRLEGGSDSREV